jgi:CelD/BcsL family acetyltransferase involved in cellulose biosynthesis
MLSSEPEMAISTKCGTLQTGGLSSEWLTSLDGIGTTWDELARACPTGHPQYLLEWLQPWHHVGSTSQSLLSVLISQGERTVAIAPLTLVRRKAHGIVPVRELRWLATGPTDQSDILSLCDARTAGVAVAAHLHQHRRLWDELHLQCVPAGSQAVPAMLDALRDSLRCVVHVKRTPNYYVDTRGDWGAYLATTSKKYVQRDLPRVRRRLAEAGEVVISHDRDPDVGTLLTLVSPVHRARQDELGRESGLSDERYAAFATEALSRLKALGMLSVWTLLVGSEVAAYLIGFEAGRVFYAWNMAHNPAYGAASPGKVLWASAIQRYFDDEMIDEFNMMRGDTEYKLRWTDISRDLLDIRVRNLATRRSALLNGLRKSVG